MEPKTGRRVHIVMGSGHPKAGSQPSRRSRQIVSKGTYIQGQAKRMGIRICGALVFLCSLLLATFGIVPLILIIGNIANMSAVPDHKRQYSVLAGLSLLVLTLLATVYVLARWGRNMVRRGIKIDPGVPLTRANTAALPARQTLVRASDEPEQAQKAVLLRAATQEQETLPEQLVRPAGEPE